MISDKLRQFVINEHSLSEKIISRQSDWHKIGDYRARIKIDNRATKNYFLLELKSKHASTTTQGDRTAFEDLSR